jgi:hypothetical protein
LRFLGPDCDKARIYCLLTYERYFGSIGKYVALRRQLRGLIIAEGDHEDFETDRAIFDELTDRDCYHAAKEYFLNLQVKLERSQELNALIKRSRILYIAPGPVSYWPDHHSYDFVVVSNMLLSKSQIPSDYPVEKLIVFYNAGFARRHSGEIKDDAARIALGLFKINESLDHSNTFINLSSACWNSYGLMGAQNVVGNIALCDVENLTIVGVDCFLSSSPFRKGIKDYEPSKQHYSNILRRHEAISNFLFIKFLVNAFHFEVYCTGCEWRHLTAEGYAKYLDEMYSEFPLKPVAGYGY